MLITGLVLLVLVHTDYQRSISTSQQAHQAQCVTTFEQVRGTIDEVFQTIYLDLRMIARLPGISGLSQPDVVEIEYRGGEGLDENTLANAQEVYNSLASNVAVSELYIVPANFDPDAPPDSPDKSREPWITFDELIINRSMATDVYGHQEGPVEIEIYEYRLMHRQLSWFKQHYPHKNAIRGLEYPAVSGPEVVTCDNRYYSMSDPNDDNRKGLVISVPFYGLDGHLRGMVSTILLTRELKAMMPSGDFAISESKYGTFIPGRDGGQSVVSARFASLGMPDNNLAYSMTRKLNTFDTQGDWVLWMGQPNPRFWDRPDTAAAVNARNAGYGYVVIYFLTAGPGVWLVLRSRKQLMTANQHLKQEVKEQTEKLRQTLQAYEQQTRAIGQHAGILLTDVRGIIEHANDKLCELSGYRPDELKGQHWKLLDSVNHAEDRHKQVWVQLAQGKTWHGELRQRTKGGGHYWVSATTVPICDGSGKITQYLSVRTDVSAYKEDSRHDTQQGEHLRESA